MFVLKIVLLCCHFLHQSFCFNWRIITLQYCVDFCCVIVEVCHICVCVYIYIYIPIPLELSFPFPSHPRRLSQSSFILVLSLIHASVGPPSSPNGKEPACQCRRRKRLGFDPWVWKIPWSRKCNHSSILAWRIR